MNRESEILGHHSIYINHFNTRGLKITTPLLECFILVKFGPEGETAGPREDARYRVGASLLALLVLSVMTSNSPVGSLRFYGLAVRGHQLRSHHAQRAKSLCEHIRLYVSVVVFACPYETTVGLNGLSDHVVNQSVLIPETLGFKLGLVLAIHRRQWSSNMLRVTCYLS